MVVTKLVLDVGKALSSIEMKVFWKQNSRISKDVWESLQSKCELQLIPMAISIQYETFPCNFKLFVTYSLYYHRRVFSALSKLNSHDGLRRVSDIAMNINIALVNFAAQNKCMSKFDFIGIEHLFSILLHNNAYQLSN